MPSALFLLLQLRIRAAVRKVFRGIRTPRGAIFFVMGVLVFGCWLTSMAMGLFLNKLPADSSKAELVAPMILLMMAVGTLLFSSRTKAVHFDRAEVDFLFAAPFTRRQLLVYKFAGSVIAAALASLIFSIFIKRFTSLWLAACLGSFLALMFNQLLSTTLVMARVSAARRAFTIIRQGLLLAITMLLIAGVLAGVNEGPSDPWIFAQRFEESIYGTILLAPFQVFAHVITAPRIAPDLAAWSVAAIAILALLGFVIVRLDADFMEASVAASQKMYERMQHYRRTGSMLGTSTGKRGRIRLPMLPRWHGAGPIAWRQLVTAMRSSRALLLALLITGLAMGPVLVLGRVSDRASTLVVPVMLWMTIFLVNATRYDFRGDLDHMDWLRSMPTRPLWVAVGELAAPVIVLTIFQLLLLASVAAIVKSHRDALFIAMAFVVPWNVFHLSIENVTFLCFPAKTMATGPGDLQGAGRNMVVMTFKLALLAAGAGLAFGLGALAWLVGGESLLVGGVILWLALAGIGFAVVLFIARAFLRFDPSLDMPA